MSVMSIPASSWIKFLRAALLIVLLAAQGLAAAHEFTHWDHPAQELCATCSLSSGLDAPLAPAGPVLDGPRSAVFFSEYSLFTLHTRKPRPYFQRAPPVSL